MDVLVVRAPVSLPRLVDAIRHAFAQAGWVERPVVDEGGFEVELSGDDESAAAWLPAQLRGDALASAVAAHTGVEAIVVSAGFPAGRRGADPHATRFDAAPGEAVRVLDLDAEAEEIAAEWTSDGPIFAEEEAAYDLAGALAKVSDGPAQRLRIAFGRDVDERIATLLAAVQAATSWAWTTSRGRPALRLVRADGTTRLEVVSDAVAATLRARLPQ